jgi:quercetin dioxygenase-like cupin family protein
MQIDRRRLLRHSLIAAALAPSELLLAPAALAESAPRPADPAQWFWFPGHSFLMKSTTVDTNGVTGWVLCEAAARSGVPFHKHSREDESFFVVDGTFELSVGERTIRGGPGTYAFGPRDVPHRWTNIGETRGRILNVFTPAGFEQMFYELGLPIPASDAPPPQNPAPLIARMNEVTAKYGNTRTGDFKFPPAPHPH